MIFPPRQTDKRQCGLQARGPRGHHRGKACKPKLMSCKSGKTTLKKSEESSRIIKTIRIVMAHPAAAKAHRGLRSCKAIGGTRQPQMLAQGVAFIFATEQAAFLQQ